MFGLQGWVTKTGVIIFAIGGALLAAGDLYPIESGVAWCKFLGTLLSFFGAAIGGIGVARKVDKGNVSSEAVASVVAPIAVDAIKKAVNK